MIILFATLFLATAPLTPTPWADGTVDAALAQAAHQRPVLVYVSAHWCGPCAQLGLEVIDTPAGQKAAAGAVAVRVDFDTPAGQAATRRYRVLNLPTVLVLDPNGVEMGRVEGYSGRADFLEELAQIRRGARSIGALREAVADTPGDTGAVVALGEALLVRGELVEAKALLDRAMAAGGSIGARAARTWGRWLVRVKRDGAAGAPHFLTWMKKTRGKPSSDGFRYWAARALVLQGKRQEALALFDQRIMDDPRSPGAALLKGDFMLNNGYPAQAALTMIRLALSLDGSNPEVYYLMAKARLRLGDTAGAVEAIERAIRLKPKTALFQNFRRLRLGLTGPIGH